MICLLTLLVSLQHHNGLYICLFSLVDHMGLENARNGKDGFVWYDESWDVVSLPDPLDSIRISISFLDGTN